MPLSRASIPLSYADILSVFFDLATPSSKRKNEADIVSFETNFAARYEAPQGVAFCKARMAFYHLLMALKLPQGAEVVISALHIADFVNMILLADLKPVVVDVAKDGYNLDLDDLENKVSGRTGTVLITHLAGYPTDMDRVRAILADSKAVLLEDCSQAVTATFKGKPLGSFGRASIYSLSLLKSVCTLTGGMVVSNDEDLLEHLRSVAGAQPRQARLPLMAEAVKNLIIKTAFGFPLFDVLVFPLLKATTDRSDFVADYQKTNKTASLREQMPASFLEGFSGPQARLGLRQLDTLEEREEPQIRNGRRLYDILSKGPGNAVPASADMEGNTYWLFPICLSDPSRLRHRLQAHGFDCSPMLLRDISREQAFDGLIDACTNSIHRKTHTLFIPAHKDMTIENINELGRVIINYLEQEGSSQ